MKSLFFILILTLSISSFAEDKIIESGFNAFKEGGATEAWSAWMKGGALDGSNELMAQASQFGTVTAYYGNYISHEYIEEKSLGQKNKVVYIIMNMDKGPLYGTFFLYKLPNGKWTAANFMLHMHANQVWPVCMYSNCSK